MAVHTRSRDEQFSISVHVSETPIGEEERSELLEMALSARFKAERAAAKGENLELSEPQKGKRAGALSASYTGYDAAAQRRFTNLTIVNDEVIASFYFEALDMSVEQFAGHSQEIMAPVEAC